MLHLLILLYTQWIFYLVQPLPVQRIRNISFPEAQIVIRNLLPLSSPASPGSSTPSSTSDRELHFRQFSDHFALTDREKEILQMLLTSDESMQELADRLYISRTMLYRHVASLNEKTSTKSRISLIQFYYGRELENSMTAP